MPSKNCYVCTGLWSQRMLRSERDEFDLMNPSRDPSSKSPLNPDQQAHIFSHFFDEMGKCKSLCKKHLAFYASVGERTVGNLRKMFVNRIPGQLFSLDRPPPRKLKRVANNKTPSTTVNALVNWCVQNSSVMPGTVNIRRFTAPYTSMKKAFRAFVKQNWAHKMCWETFRVLRSLHCPGIKVKILFMISY